MGRTQKWISSSKIICFFLLLSFTILCTACGPMDQSQAKPDYQETKQMVIDILQTEEGKKIIEDVMSDTEVRSQFILSQPNVREAIESTLLSAENKDKWQELFADPEFAKEYAEHLEEEHKKLIKDLMKDPEYRASMMEILQDPEMETQFLEVAKSKNFRQQTMSVMKEALESPYFRLELLELLSKVAQDPPDPEEGQNGEGEDGGGGGSGNGDEQGNNDS